MPIQIEIQDGHADLLIEFYIERLRTLKNEIIAREKETKEINNQIIKLKRGKNNTALPESQPIQPLKLMSEYSEKWPWIKKIEFAMNVRSDEPLTTREIVDVLIDYEVGLMFDKKKAIASVSSILSTKSGKGKEFTRYTTDSGDFAYEISSDTTEIEEPADLPF